MLILVGELMGVTTQETGILHELYKFRALWSDSGEKNEWISNGF